MNRSAICAPVAPVTSFCLSATPGLRELVFSIAPEHHGVEVSVKELRAEGAHFCDLDGLVAEVPVQPACRAAESTWVVTGRVAKAQRFFRRFSRFSGTAACSIHAGSTDDRVSA